MSIKALEDIKVLDLTHHIAGPYCTKLLADYGADVIKIERPVTGDVARTMAPFFKDDINLEKSGMFLFLNTNKKSITLNLKSPTGQDIFKRLVKNVDILVENFRPGVMASFGLDYETLENINPKLVMTSISNFGQTGPYRDFKSSDLINAMMGGESYSSGLPQREPVKGGWGTVTLYEGAVAAAAAIMATFYGVRHQGLPGQYIDISLMETQCGGDDMRPACLIAFQYCGEVNPRLPAIGAGYPSGVFPCKDGYIDLSGGRMFWSKVVKMLGEPTFLKDPKWTDATAQSNPALKEEFEAFLIGWLMERTRREVWEAAEAANAVLAPLFSIEDLFSDPSLDERGFFVEILHPTVGKLKYPGRPFIMNGTPWQITRSSPLLGQHNEEVYGQLGYSKQELVEFKRRGII